MRTETKQASVGGWQIIGNVWTIRPVSDSNLCFLPQLHLSPHRGDASPVSFSVRPRAQQNRRDPGCDHVQLHRCVWTLPLGGRVQVRVPAEDRWAMWIWAVHFPALPAVLRSDQPQHLTEPPVLHLPLSRRPTGAPEVSALSTIKTADTSWTPRRTIKLDMVSPFELDSCVWFLWEQWCRPVETHAVSS